MKDDLTKKDFAEHLNTKFRINLQEGGFVELEMVEAKDVGSDPRQEQFSITFRGVGDFFLNQGNYQLEHDEMGPLLLFLVPVGKQEDGFYYEAAFNRLITEESE